MAENTNVFKSSMKTLKEKIGNTEINAQTIITILRFSMEVVEATQLKGEAQKELAIKLVRQVVD
jgi:predicted nucleic acid-binding protein